MIDLIIFDLDGVLIDTEDIHHNLLIDSINKFTNISISDLVPVIKKDGSTTKSKLENLKQIYNIPNNVLYDIDNHKQNCVLTEFDKIQPNNDQIEMLSNLERMVPYLAIGSNSRKENVYKILKNLNIERFFSCIITANDVVNTKPNPEIFIRIMSMLGCKGDNTLILEDSIAGQTAAKLSSAHLLYIHDITDVNYENIKNELQKYKTNYNCTDGRDGYKIFGRRF
jgi:HAD superfamily hydrolase (TIGR01509 family)